MPCGKSRCISINVVLFTREAVVEAESPQPVGRSHSLFPGELQPIDWHLAVGAVPVQADLAIRVDCAGTAVGGDGERA